MKQNYKLWDSARKRFGEAARDHDSELESEMLRIARLICTDLNRILDFLRKMRKGELEDHYGRYRFISEELVKNG